MKKLLLVLLFLFMLPLCKADLYSSKFLVLNADISTEFEIESDKITPEIEFITANFSFFPKDFDNQKILSNYFYPPPRNIKNGVAEFEWRNPIEKKFTIDIKSKAMVESSKIKIRSKVKFPIKWLPEEIKRYTLPTETIDINDAIAEKASEIASGKDDLFDVVDSIAYWVNSNIKYNVSTTTAEASQKSSWVFKNREGVCDEITSLFISMLRSLGIPARFVAGIAYTESPDFKEKWGPHGWAEVYFPDYGWVPYDVTYAEYGWVDATHIKATELDDIGKAYTSFSWKAEEGVNLKPSKVKTAVTIESIGNEKEPEIMIESKIYDNDVGFGSYNAVIVTIENLEDYYISKDFYIAKTSSIDIVGEQRKHVLLRPDEIKQIYWILKVDENLDKKYLYTFPIEVLTLDNISTMTEFKSVYDEEVFSLEEIENAIADIEKESEKVYSKNFEINCTTGKKEFYIYERPLLDCTIKNLGNILLKDLALCLNEECRLMTIGITQQKGFNFTIDKIKEGKNNFKLRIYNEHISDERDIEIIGLDEPKLSISSLEYPINVSYKDEFSINYIIKKGSNSTAYNVVIKVYGPAFEKIYSLGNLEESENKSVNLRGNQLNIGENKFVIDLAYEDGNKRKYNEKEEITVNLSNVTFFQKMMIFLRNLFK